MCGLYVFFVHAHACRFSCLFCACGGQRVASSLPLLLFFERWGLLLNLGLTSWRANKYQASSVSTSQHLDYRCVLLYPVLYVGTEDLHLMLAK